MYNSGRFPPSIVSVTSDRVGTVLNARIPAEAGVPTPQLMYPPFNLLRYQAITAITFDAAMASAIKVCSITGGTIICPTGQVTFAAQINMNQKRNIILQGQGGNTNGSSPTTSLIYNGTVGPFIIWTSVSGCAIRDCQIGASNAGFTAALLKCGNDGLGHGDSFMNEVRDCTFGLINNQYCVHLDLDKTIDFTAKRCLFFAGAPSVTGQASAGGSYANVVDFIECNWQGCLSGPVAYAGEDWTFLQCTWEPLVGGAAGAFFNNANTPAKSLTFIGSWMGDVTAGGGTWVKVFGSAATGGAFNFIGNRMGGSATNTTAIEIDSLDGANIVGNRFDTFTTVLNFGDANSTSVVYQANKMFNVTNVFGNPANAPTNLVFNPNTPLVVPPANAPFGNFSANGFEVSPNGMIRMRGTKTVTQGVPLAITFATEVGRAFPNAYFTGNANAETAGYSVSVSGGSTTGLTLTLNGGAGSSVVDWQAIGN